MLRSAQNNKEKMALMFFYPPLYLKRGLGEFEIPRLLRRHPFMKVEFGRVVLRNGFSSHDEESQVSRFFAFSSE
jgi:hypothetical protein